MEVVHGATIDRDPEAGDAAGTPRRRYGNALLSAHPVRTWQASRLPGSARREARGLVDAIVDVDGTEVRVLVTHLQNRSRAERRAGGPPADRARGRRPAPAPGAAPHDRCWAT